MYMKNFENSTLYRSSTQSDSKRRFYHEFETSSFLRSLETNLVPLSNYTTFQSHTIVDGKSPLHRAFSLFHFNSSKKLLIQKRSLVKVTFPDLWTNTCCSHPLYTLSEMDDFEGVKTAAKRRADFELGLKLDARKIHHLTRILYSSNCSETLAENELDHCVLSFGDFDFSANPDEVSDTKVLIKALTGSLFN